MKSTSANWIYYNAREPKQIAPSLVQRYDPDCQLRAWSKALDMPYADLARHLDLPSIDRTLDGKYQPYWRPGILDKDRTDKKFKDFQAMNNQLRTDGSFPEEWEWDGSFGRYIKDYRTMHGYGEKKFAEEPEDLDMWCEEHQTGTYVVTCQDMKSKKRHAVAVVDGKFYDTWDSGALIVDGWYLINTNKIILDRKPKNAGKKGNFFRKLKERKEMKKTYSKKQIVEAISFWEKKLENLDESSLENLEFVTVNDLYESLQKAIESGHGNDKVWVDVDVAAGSDGYYESAMVQSPRTGDVVSFGQGRCKIAACAISDDKVGTKYLEKNA